jgi:signal recognition particle GTPase
MSLAKNSNQHEVCQTLLLFNMNSQIVPDIVCSVQLEAFKKQLMKSLSEDNLLVSCVDQIFLFTLSQDLLLPFKSSLLLELLCEQMILLACFHSNCLKPVKITTQKI